jgi:hypothetical protein
MLPWPTNQRRYSGQYQLENVTYVVYKVGLVAPNGSLDVSAGEINQTADELVACAHINGVPIIMGISGRLSGIDGWAIYETNDFGTPIQDPAKRTSLVTAIKAYHPKKNGWHRYNDDGYKL